MGAGPSGSLVRILGIGNGFKKQTYTKLDTGQVVFRVDEDGCELIAVVPDGWEYEQDEDEVIITADDEEMQGRDRNEY